MLKMLNMFIKAHSQTKFFIFMFVLYMGAIVWTTIQAYARLEYSRSDFPKPIIIQTQPTDHHDK